ncbi:MAG: carbamoyl phosphate synthase small subunit [Dehalococcoidia bacterium]
MLKERYLILNDGSVYQGYGFGHESEAIGEVVFNTSMTGYQEMLTDPSYRGQILVSTYPMIGNYGIDSNFSESNKVQVKSYVVRDLCDYPFHFSNNKDLNEFLTENKIPGIHSVDTRSLTRKIRKFGSKMAIMTDNPDLNVALEKINKFGSYEESNYVDQVSVKKIKSYVVKNSNLNIALIDFGVKKNIIRLLNSRGCNVEVYPWNFDFTNLDLGKFDGIVMSPGPGDPKTLLNDIKGIKKCIESIPSLGICLGHQIIAHIYGGETFKLLFGHRGGNQPVKEINSGRVYPTSQNHGYAVSDKNFPSELEVTHININDNTVSGLKHKEKPIISIQYHSEACPGPVDSEYIFDNFLELIKGKIEK